MSATDVTWTIVLTIVAVVLVMACVDIWKERR